MAKWDLCSLNCDDVMQIKAKIQFECVTCIVVTCQLSPCSCPGFAQGLDFLW